MSLISAEVAELGHPGTRKITRTSDGNLHVFWYSPSGDLRYAYGTDAGWTVVGNILASAPFQTTPSVCTDGTDCYIAWIESSRVYFGVGVGASWTNRGFVTGDNVPHSYPAIAITSSGRIWLAFAGYTGASPNRRVVYVYYTDNGGVSWTLYQTIAGACYVADYPIDKSLDVSICIDKDDNPYVAFSRMNVSNSHYKLDVRREGYWSGGWGEYVPENWREQRHPCIVVDEDKRAHLIYCELDPAVNKYQIYHARQQSGDTFFNYLGRVATSSYEQTDPQAVIGNDGHIYAVWVENFGGSLRQRYAYFAHEYDIWIDMGYVNTPQGFSEYSPRARWARHPASDRSVSQLNVLWTGSGNTYHTGVSLPTVGVSISAPAGGEVWAVGSQQLVRWSVFGSGIDHLELDYSINGGSSWITIDHTLGPTVREYVWTVPSTPSDACRVRIVAKDAGGGTLGSGQSMANFSIGGTPIATIVFQVRSGPDDGSGGFGAWEEWRPVTGLEFSTSPSPIQSTLNEYVQWKAKFESVTTRKTPILR